MIVLMILDMPCVPTVVYTGYIKVAYGAPAESVPRRGLYNIRLHCSLFNLRTHETNKRCHKYDFDAEVTMFIRSAKCHSDILFGSVGCEL